MFIFIPSSFIRLFFPAEQRQSPAGRPRSLDHPSLAQPIGGFAPPQHQKKAASAAESHPCLAAYPRGTAHHPSQPQFPFLSKGTHPLQRQTWHCRVPQFPPYRCSALGHLSPPAMLGAPGTLPARPSWGPLAPSILFSREPSLGKGKELLMQNKWNQSKQKAAGLLLVIAHPRV